MKEETRLRVINYFWIAVTIFMAICTLYVSIFTIRDTVRMNSQIAVLDKDIARYEAALNGGGTLLLSGFLEGDVEEILAATNALNLKLVTKLQEEEWVALKLTK